MRTGFPRFHGLTRELRGGASHLLANLPRRAEQPRQPADIEHDQRPHDLEARGEVFGDPDERRDRRGQRIQAGKHDRYSVITTSRAIVCEHMRERDDTCARRVRRGDDNRACTERPARRRLRSWSAGPASLMASPVLPAAAWDRSPS